MSEHGRCVLSNVCTAAGPENCTDSVDPLAVRTITLKGMWREKILVCAQVGTPQPPLGLRLGEAVWLLEPVHLKF